MILKKITTFVTIIVFSTATIGCSSTPETSTKSSESATTSGSTNSANKNVGAGQMSTGSQVGSYALKLLIGVAISAAIANAAKKKTESNIKDQIQNALGN